MRHQNTIQQLKTNPLWAITVVNKKDLQKVVINATGNILQEQYGSVENFFEDMFSKGITDIRVYERRKNGSTYRLVQEYDWTMLPKDAAEHKSAEVKTEKAVVDLNFNNGIPGLSGLSGLAGMEATYKFMDHPRLMAEVQRLSSENDTLKRDNESLKEANLRNELSGDKANSNKELILGLAPLLAPFLSKMTAGAAAAPGLSGTDKNRTPAQMKVIDIIDNSDDLISTYLGIIGDNIENEAFANGLVELMQKHNLIPS